VWARAAAGRAAPGCAGQAVGALQAHPWRGAAGVCRGQALAEHAALRRACTGGRRAAAAARRDAAAARRAAAALAGRRPGARRPLAARRPPAARRGAAALGGRGPGAWRHPRLRAASVGAAGMRRPARGPLRGRARAWCASCGAAALPAHDRRGVRVSAALPGGRRGRGIRRAACCAAVGHGAGGRAQLALCRVHSMASRCVGMRGVHAVALRVPLGAGAGAGCAQARLVRRPDRLHDSAVLSPSPAQGVADPSVVSCRRSRANYRRATRDRKVNCLRLPGGWGACRRAPPQRRAGACRARQRRPAARPRPGAGRPAWPGRRRRARPPPAACPAAARTPTPPARAPAARPPPGPPCAAEAADALRASVRAPAAATLRNVRKSRGACRDWVII